MRNSSRHMMLGPVSTRAIAACRRSYGERRRQVDRRCCGDGCTVVGNEGVAAGGQDQDDSSESSEHISTVSDMDVLRESR